MGERETPGGNFELVKNIKTNSNLETWQIKTTFSQDKIVVTSRLNHASSNERHFDFMLLGYI